MELEYLWIYNFREIFVNEGFNFSFEFNYLYDINTFTLSREKRKLNHDKGFYNPKISSLKGIIGKNGTGKSSLLDFIKKNLANSIAGFSSHSEDGNFIAVFSNCIINKNCVVNLSEELSHFKIINYSDIQTRYKFFNDTVFIYYSNVFDSKDDFSDNPNLISISTNYRFLKDAFTSEEKLYPLKYINHEVKRQIDLISEIGYKLDFKLPKSLSISTLYEVKQYLKVIEDDEVEQPICDQIGGLKQIENINDFKRLIFFNFLKLLNFRDGISFSELGDKLRELLENNFKVNYIDSITFSSTKTQEAVQLMGRFFNIIDELIDKKLIDFYKKDYRTFLYYIQKNNTLFYDIIKVYNQIVGPDSFLNYSWEHEVSSGEKALLAFFSRFWFAKKSIIYDFHDRKITSLIILIDECELYLHPNWQRSIFKNIVENLPLFFNNQGSIQLILTSHSPFLVSDIPISDLIFLDRIEGSAFQTNLDTKENTFGANIHNLYSDAFFLKDGLIGEFAKEKIFELMNELEKSKFPSDEEIQNFKMRINIIGEPMIRQKLFELLYKSYTNDDVRRRQEFLRKELAEISSGIENKNHEKG